MRRPARRSRAGERLAIIALFAGLGALLLPAGLLAQGRPTQVTIGIGSEPLTLMASTIVDWTTNAQHENIHDTLFARDRRPRRSSRGWPRGTR